MTVRSFRGKDAAYLAPALRDLEVKKGRYREHAACDDCWEERNPGREAVRIRDAEEVECCFCGADTSSGIYVRDRGKGFHCQDVAGIHAGGE